MTFYASDAKIAACTGYPRRDVQNAKALLERDGILVRTGRKRLKGSIEYDLRLPGYSVHGADDGLDDGTVHGADDGLGDGTVHGLGDGDPQHKQNRTELETHPETKRDAAAPTQVTVAPEPSPPLLENEKTAQVIELAVMRVLANYPNQIRNRGRLSQSVERSLRPLAADIVRRYPDADPATLAQWVHHRNAGRDRDAKNLERELGSMPITPEQQQLTAQLNAMFRLEETF